MKIRGEELGVRGNVRRVDISPDLSLFKDYFISFYDKNLLPYFRFSQCISLFLKATAESVYF